VFGLAAPCAPENSGQYANRRLSIRSKQSVQFRMPANLTINRALITTTDCGCVTLCTSFKSIVYNGSLGRSVVTVSMQLTAWNSVSMAYNHLSTLFVLISRHILNKSALPIYNLCICLLVKFVFESLSMPP